MRLDQVAAAPGRWINRDWQPGTPGAFALVVGVSRYDFLKGESTYDLGPLFVSALTSFRIFEWLRDSYYHRSCPLAKCWLALAPTDEELRTAPAMQGTYGDAMFSGIKLAIQEWTQAMKDQREAADRSRGFFFFSGHGVEIRGDHQVLLPSDYLAPPNPSLNDAISTNNLFRGLLAGRVPLHLLFLDACRNDHDALVAEGIAGANILNTGGRRNTGAIVDLFRATASGFRAWQPNTASAGESVFGQALLEGLRNTRLKECQADDCWIPVYRLQKYVNGRVMEILKSYQTLVESPVRLGGEVDDAVVTELPATGLPPAPDADEPQTDHVDDSLRLEATLDHWSPSTGNLSEKLTYATHLVEYPHDLFGSERMEEIWNSARVYDLTRRRWLDEGRGYVLHRFARDEAPSLFRATVSVPDAEGACVLELRQPWMPPRQEGLRDLAVARTFACVLPGEAGRRLLFDVVLNLEFRADDPFQKGAAAGLAPASAGAPFRWLSRVDVDLSPENSGLVGTAARLWRTFRRGGFGDAFRSREIRKLGDLLTAGRIRSPLARLVVAIIVLGQHPRRWSMLRTAGYPLRELATEAPEMPDGAIVWARQLSRDVGAQESTRERPIDFLDLLATRGMPWSAAALAMAVTLVDEQLDRDAGTDRLQTLAALKQRLEALSRSARSSGGFCSVFADLEDIGLLEPAPRAKAPQAAPAVARA